MSDSAIVIIATIGKPTLRRAVESVLNQTYKDVRRLVVVDGEEYYQAATDAVNEGDFLWGDAKRCETCKSWERVVGNNGSTAFGECGECWYETAGDFDPKCMMYLGNLEILNATLMTRFDFGCVLWEAKSNV